MLFIGRRRARDRQLVLMLRGVAPPTGRREPAAGRRALLVLAVLLMASAGVGYWHAHGGAGPMSRAASALVGPVERAGVWAVRGVQTAWLAARRSRSQEAENRRLRLRLGESQERNRELAQLGDDNQRLRRLLGLRERLPYATIAAAAVGRDLGPWTSALVIDRGRRDGVHPRQAVIALDGLVGQVVTVSERTARVLPITDPASGAGALAVRSGENGVLKGTGGSCRLRYLSLHTRVKPGDAVITSGLGGIFPAGLALGTVTRVQRQPATSTSVALVRPAQDPNRVREVLVITSAPAQRPLSQSPDPTAQDPARAPSN